MKKMYVRSLGCMLLLCLTGQVAGTVGYLPHGYGTRMIGMGGVAVAYPQDTIVAAINPAGMVYIEDRLDAGVTFFAPFRNYCYTGNPAAGIVPAQVGSGSNFFPIPHFGIKHTYEKNHALGLTLYGNGGMNTNWKKTNPVFGTTRFGGNLLQLCIAPSYSYYSQEHCQSLGIAPVFCMQFFKLKGLQNCANSVFSSCPGRVTNRGHSTSAGVAIRVGWMGTLKDHLTFGFAYTTPTWMSRIRKYEGILADNGHFNIPMQLYAGLAMKDMEGFDVAFDFGYIPYGQVPSIANSICSFAQFPFNPQAPVINNQLGSECGPGFGWQNVWVIKLGAAYKGYEGKIFRIGYAHSSDVYGPRDIDFNILAPAVVNDHFCLGCTKQMSGTDSIDFAYSYVFNNEVSGPSKFGLGNITHAMRQHLISFNYVHTFG